MIGYWEIMLRLGLAVVFGGAVGYERESQNLPAGFRTHILVCVGATLIMLVSAYGFSGPLAGTADHSRIAAAVVTGIGFLGAGTILRQQGNIRGLTTAASIWVVSGIGLAIGIGFYFPALLTTGLVLLSLLVLGRLDRTLISSYRTKWLTMRVSDRVGLMKEIVGIFSDLKLNIRKIEFSEPSSLVIRGDKYLEIEIMLVTPLNFDQNKLFQRLAFLEGVEQVSWQGERVLVDLYSRSVSSD
ncbi:MAG TPA: MgtC/SapB family protein [Firmicutes bacterium]|nr:MgtC/SapB family protein [Bacillota bacterium]